MSHDFIDIIKARGFVHQMTDEAGLRTLLETPGQTAYIGFDCTAKSLHVGSLLQIMLLRWWQKCGHRPIVLLGGGTTKIGDPSGKDESRPPLTDAQISENMESLKQVFAKFLDFGDDKAPDNHAIMVNNDDWLKDLNYAQFLRDYGRHFSINRMLTMDSVKLRLEREQTLSFLEFNYMIFQAYDFVELNRKYACRVQLGGSDQWGNIVNGVELQRRLYPASASKSDETIRETIERTIKDEKVNPGKHLYGITSPLLTTASGAKMGKTAAGAVWLNADLLKPYDYWQFWRNTEDGDVEKFLMLFTEMPLTELERAKSKDEWQWEYSIEWLKLKEILPIDGKSFTSKINEAKIILATEATSMLHGKLEARKASQIAAATFTDKSLSLDLPTIEIQEAMYFKAMVNEGIPLYGILMQAELAVSNGEAKRLIKGSGVSVNDEKILDENFRLKKAHFEKGYAKISKGKKQHILIRLV